MPDITMNEAYLRRLGNFLGDLNNLKALDVLPYHDMGKVKYQNLGIPYKLENTPPLDKSDAVKAKDIMLGVSILRNRSLANIFYRLHLIEAYGTGLPIKTRGAL